jgi:glutathione S-transferase
VNRRTRGSIATVTTAPLTLHVDAFYISPYAMSAMVALEEKRLPYTLAPVALHERAQRAPGFPGRPGRVPVLQHGDFALSESSAICEYLAETFPFPDHPRIFPADLRERGVCREVQAWIRSDLMPIREERPTHTIWYAPATTPLSDAGLAAAEKLIRVASALVADDRTTLFADWCIADADLGLMLQRLHRSGHPLPAKLVAYAEAQWRRPSVARWNALPRAPYVAY